MLVILTGSKLGCGKVKKSGSGSASGFEGNKLHKVAGVVTEVS